MPVTRRHAAQLVLGTLSAGLVPADLLAQAKPNSRIAGVQVGVMVPNSLVGVANDLKAYRDALLKIGLSGCETHVEPWEKALGAPSSPAALSQWRMGVPMDQFAEAKKIWIDAGIDPDFLGFGKLVHRHAHAPLAERGRRRWGAKGFFPGFHMGLAARKADLQQRPHQTLPGVRRRHTTNRAPPP